MRKSFVNILLVVALSVVIIIACQTVNAGQPKQAKETKLLPTRVELVDLQKIYVGKKDPCKGPIVIDLVFNIYNPNSIPVEVNPLEWTVSVENTRLGAMAVHEGVFIPAKKNAQVRKTYLLNAQMGAVNLLLAGAVINLQEGGKVFGGICNAILEDKALWKLEGTAYIDSKIGSISAPFTIEWK